MKDTLIQDGAKQLHILADFDRTLTTCFVDGEKRPSMISVLRDDPSYLSESYRAQAKELFAHYHPLELDASISLKRKKEIMQEWWGKHNDLLVSSGLTRQHIEDIAQTNLLKLRDGYRDFFDALEEKEIPLVIISASGIGGPAIEYFLRAQGVWSENISIIGNDFLWDKEGKALGMKGNIIHTFNKDESAIEYFPEIYQKLQKRKNVLLLGDSIGDTKMIGNFEYKNIWRIGFLNEDVDKLRSIYLTHYDELIEGDGSLSSINSILQQLS